MTQRKPRSSLSLILFGLLLFVQVTACGRNHTDSYPSVLMSDKKFWMSSNLNLNIPGSSCYENDEANCKVYGRLYTWQSAAEACAQLGKGWRLPSSDEWWRLANSYGKEAYKALIAGGSANFNVVFGGGRESNNGAFLRKGAHGFYWTSSEINATSAWFYNLGTGGQMVTRHDGEKDRAFSVRCIRD